MKVAPRSAHRRSNPATSRITFTRLVTRTLQIVLELSRLLVYYFHDRTIRRGKPSLMPIHLTQFLSNLGATFIKFGQIMAMRPDFLPEEYCSALLKLVDDVPPFATELAIQQISEELGEDPNLLFATFGERPVAAASFGQVYQATLKNGERVAVKVQRPGLATIVGVDLKLLGFVINLFDYTINLGRLKFQYLLKDFERWTRDELDYMTEASYAEQIYRNAVDNPDEKIPRVYWEYTTSRVLVLEFLEGTWLKDILLAIRQRKADGLPDEHSSSSSPAPGLLEDGAIDLASVSQKLIYNFLHQVFDHGMFHGDPHAGNIVVQSDGSIGYVDFGITGRMRGDFSRRIQMFMSAVSVGDVDAAYASFLDILDPPGYLDLRGLEASFKENLESWLNSQYFRLDTGRAGDLDLLKKRSMAGLLAKNLQIMRRFGLFFPDVVVRYYRALTIIDVVLLELDPELDIKTSFQSFARKQRISQAFEQMGFDRRMEGILEMQRLLRDLPGRLNTILDTAVRVETTAATRFVQLRGFAFGLLRFARRTALALSLGFVAIKTAITLGLELPLDPAILGLFASWANVAVPVAAFLLLSFLFRVLARYEPHAS